MYNNESNRSIVAAAAAEWWVEDNDEGEAVAVENGEA